MINTIEVIIRSTDATLNDIAGAQQSRTTRSIIGLGIFFAIADCGGRYDPCKTAQVQTDIISSVQGDDPHIGPPHNEDGGKAVNYCRVVNAAGTLNRVTVAYPNTRSVTDGSIDYCVRTGRPDGTVTVIFGFYVKEQCPICRNSSSLIP
ncbi:MAG: hypothetical protein GY826_00120 [Fuerstiella sp.]|nr:hypothetical protein [Fuerstiella sp.]